MSSSNVGVVELFHRLESNKLGDVEEMKKIFHNHFLSTKENWLVNGLFDYYLSTNSLRVIEVLAGVREPHDKHLLDRLTDCLSKPSAPERHEQRIQALTVLGHVARRQPTWLYKLANHALFRELLKLLKTDTDALSLMSGLLLLVTLLPMLPVALGPHLPEIFEIFGRLAFHHFFQSSNLVSITNNTNNNMGNDQLYLLHLQVGLYSLFHRLYAMYPCNFIAYLKLQYSPRDQDPTFIHTIKPMLDSVRLHPSLVTASKDAEINAARWKKMEHHDVVAECGRFALDRNRDEISAPINPRATPILDQPFSYPSVCGADGLMETVTSINGEENIFWSPSMAVPPQSPPSLQPQGNLESRSTPSTPNNNRSNSSPPEAAVEATPETTPVKDIRQSSRQPLISSAAVRALGAFGNGSLTANSRPSTPTLMNSNPTTYSLSGIGGDGGCGNDSKFSQKISRLVAERQTVVSETTEISRNGKNDSWKEDQEVREIVNNSVKRIDLSEKSKRSRFQSHSTVVDPANNVQRSKSCPDMKLDSENIIRTTSESRTTNETSTQTIDIIQYLLTGLSEERHQYQQTSRQNSNLRLSPTSMIDRYIERCSSRFNNSNYYQTGEKKAERHRRKVVDDDIEYESTDENNDLATQQFQLMHMQLLFERQRREVHAERNRRLLGKLRGSRALEEQNTALADRLRMAEQEIEGLKNEIVKCKKESKLAEIRYTEALNTWQSQCVEEQQRNRSMRNRAETLESELKSERKKLSDCEQQTREAEAKCFNAEHLLEVAVKAANRSEELKRTLDDVQKRFLLLGEAQIKLQERNTGPIPMLKQEAALIQKSYSEDLSNLRRQLDSRTSLVEAMRYRLVELENREVRIEDQLLDQQRLLQETKERNEAELCAVESKYKAQVEINLLLESRILELHGNLEMVQASSTGTISSNLASSVSPKERSPPLSGSLASSSDGSLAFHSGIGIISDCPDSSGEIPNLQAIIEPVPSTSTHPAISSRPISSQRQVPKRE